MTAPTLLPAPTQQPTTNRWLIGGICAGIALFLLIGVAVVGVIAFRETTGAGDRFGALPSVPDQLAPATTLTEGLLAPRPGNHENACPGDLSGAYAGYAPTHSQACWWSSAAGEAGVYVTAATFTAKPLRSGTSAARHAGSANAEFSGGDQARRLADLGDGGYAYWFRFDAQSYIVEFSTSNLAVQIQYIGHKDEKTGQIDRPAAEAHALALARAIAANASAL